MNGAALQALREIGALLDQGKFPSVRNGGLVVPGESVVIETPGQERKNELRSEERRPAAGSRQGTTRRKGKTRRSRPPGAAAPLVRNDLRDEYEAGLESVHNAYPDLEVWRRSRGMWLAVESLLLPELDRRAAFLIYLPFKNSNSVRSWGFWNNSLNPAWIGPRHTNFPDGSICAYFPKDGTWRQGCDLVRLIDLYSVWALRHLHLKQFGRWPGYQYAPHAYERRTEFQDDEHCGCENPKGRYAECCKVSDLSANLVDLMLDFMSKHPDCGERKPPKEVVQFFKDRKTVPPVIE